MSANSLYGSRISLISKSNIRYVGTLHEMNEVDSTVSLEKVRSMGTEGRKGNPSEEIPPSQEVYAFIQFRATDIIDIRLEGPADPPSPTPPAVPDDPAILGSSTAAPQQPTATSAAHPPAAYTQGPPHPQYMMPPSGAAGPYWNQPPMGPGPPPAQHQQQQAAQAPPTIAQATPVTNRGDYPPPSTGSMPSQGVSGDEHPGSHQGHDGYRGRGRGRGYRRRPSGYRYNNQRVNVPKSDFDFETANAKFNKDDLLKEFVKLAVSNEEAGAGPSTAQGESVGSVASAAPRSVETTRKAPKGSAATGPSPNEDEVVIPPPEAYYNKSTSFFDNISCEAKERSEHPANPAQSFPTSGGRPRRTRMHEERKLNVETFGQPQAHGRYYRNSGYAPRGYRGGGGGRGYRGGGRGRGRGGYYNNYNGSYNNYNQNYRYSGGDYAHPRSDGPGGPAAAGGAAPSGPSGQPQQS